MSYQLIPLDGALPIWIDKTDAVVGRTRSRCDVLLKGPQISKRHARLTWRDRTLTIVDLGSRNGTWLNGVQIDSTEVLSGDELAFGACRFRVELSVFPPQPVCVPVEDEQKTPAVSDSTTTISLELLDQLLDRASDLQEVAVPMAQTPLTADDDLEDSPPFDTPLTTTVVESVSPALAQAPSACGDDVMQKLLAEFDQAKAAKLAAKSAETVVTSKLPPPYSQVSVEATTAVELSDDPPLRSEPLASAPTAVNETSPTFVDRPLWKPSSQPERRTRDSQRSPTRQSTAASGWQGQTPKWASSPATLAAITVVLLVSGWFWFGTCDGARIELCLRLRNELVERRTQGKASGPEWEAFCREAVVELKVLKKELDQSVDASQPQRQALLFAVRDELPLMLSQSVHWKRELSPEAAKREELFDRHLKIAQGLLPWKETVASTHGSAPPANSPEPMKSPDATNTPRSLIDRR